MARKGNYRPRPAPIPTAPTVKRRRDKIKAAWTPELEAKRRAGVRLGSAVVPVTLFDNSGRALRLDTDDSL